MLSVELGFLEQCDPWKLECRLFPSKVGGKPAWLSLKPLPTLNELSCENCHKVMIFLCQVYAPYESESTDDQNSNFHRTIFIFLCRNKECNELDHKNIKVIRSNLPRVNDFYPSDPPKDEIDPSFNIRKWSEICNLCGVSADKKCSRCKCVSYCCRDHQIVDWKYTHKSQCLSEIKSENKSMSSPKVLFPEWELVTETEEIEDNFVDEKNAFTEYKKLEAEGKTGTLHDVSDSDLSQHATSEIDRVFAKFKKRVDNYPSQVLRYSRGGEPLLISRKPLPVIPNCEYCGGSRQFEFQIMPQLLSELKEYDLDWGTLLIFTCKNSCDGTSVNDYKSEYIVKQNIDNTTSIC